MDKDKAIKEIKQLKELLDSGILTQDEYDVKSADLKKIILDSENKKDEPSETEKEYLEKKAESKPQINPPKTEEKKLEVQEEVELKSPSNESSKDSEKPKTEITNSTGGFRKWLNKKESPLTNFLYIALGFIVIPSGFFVYMTFQTYVLGLPDGSSTYGEYPFESNYVYLVVWFAMGVPIILLISYLISLIKSLKVKTVKVFFFFTVLEILLFTRTFQTTIYPALNLNKNNVSETQKRIKELSNKEDVKEVDTKSSSADINKTNTYNNGIDKYSANDYRGAIGDFTKVIEVDPSYRSTYYWRAQSKYNLNDYRGAIADFTKSLEYTYKEGTYFYRGYCRYKLKDSRGAIADFTKAIQTDSNVGRAYDWRGVAKISIRDDRGACADLRKAINLGEKSNLDYYNRECK